MAKDAMCDFLPPSGLQHQGYINTRDRTITVAQPPLVERGTTPGRRECMRGKKQWRVLVASFRGWRNSIGTSVRTAGLLTVATFVGEPRTMEWARRGKEGMEGGSMPDKEPRSQVLDGPDPSSCWSV